MTYTIADIAKLVGVSKATVSRVINNKSDGVGQETKEKILKTIEEVGYRPNSLARSITRKESRMIGVIIPDITNPFFPQLVRGIDDYLSQQGYAIFLCNSDNDPDKENKYLLSFIEKRVDGVIIATGNEHVEAIAELRKYSIPIAFVDRVVHQDYADVSVCINNLAGAMQAVQYLVKKGKKNIAFLGGGNEVITSKQRLEGYKLGLLQAGIPIDEQLIYTGYFSIESGYKLAMDLLGKGIEVDGIFAACDAIAIGALKALKAEGKKVPKEVEVIGFDNIEIGRIFEPELSTISQPIYEMAVEVSKMLLEVIAGKSVGIRHIMIEPTLVLRNTTT